MVHVTVLRYNEGEADNFFESFNGSLWHIDEDTFT